jgi:DNA-binding NtrC family response regulator
VLYIFSSQRVTFLVILGLILTLIKILTMLKMLTKLFPDEKHRMSEIDFKLNDTSENRLILFIDDDYVNYLYFKELFNETNTELIQTTSLAQSLHILTIESKICLILLSSSFIENKDNILSKTIKLMYPYIPIITVIDDTTQQSDIDYLQAKSEIYINRYTDQDYIIEVLSNLFEETKHSNELQISK